MAIVTGQTGRVKVVKRTKKRARLRGALLDADAVKHTWCSILVTTRGFFSACRRAHLGQALVAAIFRPKAAKDAFDTV
jgi:hypothetical protein